LFYLFAGEIENSVQQHDVLQGVIVIVDLRRFTPPNSKQQAIIITVLLRIICSSHQLGAGSRKKLDYSSQEEARRRIHMY
jgi:hypothetical protein